MQARHGCADRPERAADLYRGERLGMECGASCQDGQSDKQVRFFHSLKSFSEVTPASLLRRSSAPSPKRLWRVGDFGCEGREAGVQHWMPALHYCLAGRPPKTQWWAASAGMTTRKLGERRREGVSGGVVESE